MSLYKIPIFHKIVFVSLFYSGLLSIKEQARDVLRSFYGLLHLSMTAYIRVALGFRPMIGRLHLVCQMFPKILL